MSIAQLGYEIDSSQALEAERNLDKMGAAADKAGGQAEGLEKKSTGLSRTLKSLAPIAAGLAVSLAAMFSVRSVINAAEQYETRMARVNAVIRATGGVAGRTAEQLERQAQALARATLESVDGVMNAQQVLLTFRNVQGDVFDRAIETAADLAAAMGTDIVGATRQLARALEDPINGVTALTRSGTVFTEQQRDQIRVLVESGRTLDAQNMILAELEGQYGGVSRAASRLASAKDSLGQSFTNLLIEINEVSGASEVWAGAIETVDGWIQWVTENSYVFENTVKVLGVAIATLAGAQIPALIGVLTRLPALFTAAGGAVGVFNVALGFTATLVAALGGPLTIMAALITGGAAAWLIFRDNAAEVAPTLDDVERAQRQLNDAMGVFQTRAPNSGNEAFAYAKNLEQVALAALQAAEAVLAFNQARLEGVSPEALEMMRAQPGWESNPMRGILEQQAQSQAQIEASRIALDNARRTMRALAEQAHVAGDAVNGLAFDLEAIDVVTNGVVTAISGLVTPEGGSGGGGAIDQMLSRFEALRDELRTQAEQVELWYAEAQETLQWALENERLTLQEHADMKLEIERLYQEQLNAIRMQAQAQQLGETADFFGSMASVFQQGGEKMNRVARVMGAAQALINAYVAASQVLADPSLGFFGKMAAYASVLATGLGLVNAIRGGGKGGVGSAPTGTRGVSGVTQQQQPDRRVIIDLRGEDWIRNMIEPMMEQIYSATRNGENVIFAR